MEELDITLLKDNSIIILEGGVVLNYYTRRLESFGNIQKEQLPKNFTNIYKSVPCQVVDASDEKYAYYMLHTLRKN